MTFRHRAAAVAALAIVLFGCHTPTWRDPGTAWKRVASAHFVVLTDAGTADYEAVIDRLETTYEALTAVFFENVELEPTAVVLFRHARDYRDVAPNRTTFTTMGLGKPGGALLVLSADAPRASVDAHAAAALARRFVAAGGPVPAWVDEGFARYVAGLRVMDDTAAFDFDEPPLDATFPGLIPTAKLLELSSRDFRRAATDAPSTTAWLTIRRMMAQAGAERGAKLRELLDRCATACEPEDQRRAISEVFGVSLSSLDAELLQEYKPHIVGTGRDESRGSSSVRLAAKPRAALAVTHADRGLVKLVTTHLRLEIKLERGGAVPVMSARPAATYLGTAAAPPTAVSPPTPEVAAVVAALAPAFGTCTSAYGGPPTAPHRIGYTAGIDSDGRVTWLQLQGHTPAGPLLEACIAALLADATFPTANDGTVRAFSLEIVPPAPTPPAPAKTP